MSSSYSTFKFNLPSGTSIEFRTPTYKDRRIVLRGYNREDGYLPEEALASKCLLSVNGASVIKEDWERTRDDDLAILDSWSFEDQQFYLEVFMNMFSLDEERKNNAKEVAKKLLTGEDMTTSTSKKKPV